MDLDYVIVGHICMDQTPSGARIGGTATYAARAARLLGRKVGVVTSSPDDPDSFSELFGIEFLNIRSEHWTRFENSYAAGKRIQTWTGTARPIDASDVPMSWQLAPIVHLAPIAQEVAPDLPLGCPAELCCATIQGWLRGRSSTSNVLVEVNADLNLALQYVEVAIVSEEDVVNDNLLINELATNARVLVVTRGESGCDVIVNQERHRVATTRVEVDDPTGAGDIFSAAFFISYAQSRSAMEAAQFANRFAGWILEDRARLDGDPADDGFAFDGNA